MTRKLVDGISLQDDILDELNYIDSIIFDCDGVLVDVTNSYDICIQRTSEYILKEIANLQKFDPVTSKIIDGFKATGGFNDEVDLTYAAILSIISANKLNQRGNDFIFDVIKNSDQTGIISVEKYLNSLNIDLSEIKTKLNYPGRHDNFLYSIFDQLFYGPKLYKKIFNKESKFTDDGLIENDIVLVKSSLIESLKKKFDNKIAIVTGRGKESIQYSLKDLLDQFNVENSVFLEDEPREFAKPNPNSLLRSINGIDSSHALFVGDSMEDYIMAKKATELGNKTTFCGIFGTSKDPEQKLKFFEKNNAPVILKSIDYIPKVLNLE